ncbi:hypothetical protein HELRODRAFT_185352 [Helobdella robusta]|uniref:Aquaporin n=1 Tax=Helobdella robusta TaxID=6412 RepID=T1FMQ0_HELRO|nr:hypothetical protein HELRODRAFT_185352 [Helobdella robusta]ESO09512.1 hypothetical protein HELRODRAFT_185352 [Helobdella robusta]
MKQSWEDLLTFKASRRDLATLIFWRDVSCEFVVSTFLMTVVILILTTNDTHAYQPSTTHFGLFAGFFIYSLLETWGPISCLGHPPAAFCFMLGGKFTVARTVFYTIAETVGCATGAGIGYALTPFEKRSTFVAFNPAKHGLSLAQSVFVEAVFTFNLIFCIFSVHGSDYARKFPILPNLAIGSAIGTAIMAAGTFTGGFMNPLIAFGPAIVSGDFTNHWIYWVGPYVGGIPAVFLYKFYHWVKVRHERLPKRVVPPAGGETEVLDTKTNDAPGTRVVQL